MSPVANALAMLAGAIVGAICHEAIHAAAAIALGELREVGWRGGLGGGPFVEFRAPTPARSAVVRLAPVAVGVVALIGVAVTYDGPTLSWLASAAAALGLVWSSPEDFSAARATAAAVSD